MKASGSTGVMKILLWRSAKHPQDSYWILGGDAACLFVLLSCSLPVLKCASICRNAYVAWQVSVGKYGEYARRAILAWRKIERWLAEQSPAIAKSLL